MTSKGPEECKHDNRSITYENGAKYEGELKDGKKHGKGTFTCASGDKYEGNFVDDKAHGKGTYTWARGNKYEGNWKNGKKHGTGTFTYANKMTYVGDYVDGKKHGKGTETFVNGNKYEGGYVDDKRHGKGTLTWASGKKYEGNWKNGKMHGNGKMKFSYKSDKLVKCGEWKNGKRSGSFVIGYKDGDIEFHNYCNGRLLDERMRFNILHRNQVYISKYDGRCTTNECIRWINISVERAIDIAYNNFNINIEKDLSDNITVLPNYWDYECNKYITGFLRKMIEQKMPLYYNTNRREIEKNKNREITAIIHQTSWDKRNSLVTYSPMSIYKKLII